PGFRIGNRAAGPTLRQIAWLKSIRRSSSTPPWHASCTSVQWSPPTGEGAFMTARRNGAVRGLDRVPSGETEGLDTREDFLALQRRPASRREDSDEMLIVDWRGQLRPSEQV